MRLYQQLAQLIQARINCEKTGNTEWFSRHTDLAKELVANHMPSGSGVDNGTELDFNRSTPSKIVFTTAFHHMNDNGYYDGWTEHGVIVTADLASGFEVRITGRNHRDIKDYLGEIFHSALSTVLARYDGGNVEFESFAA